MVAQDLWEEDKVEDVVLEDYFYRAGIKYDLYLGHPFLTKSKVAPVGHRSCFNSGIRRAGSSQLWVLASWVPKCKRYFESKGEHSFW